MGELVPDAKQFDVGFQALRASPEVQQLWGRGRDPDLGIRIDPYSFVTQECIEEIVEIMRQRPDSHGPNIMMDLGCGSAGPGLEIAARCGFPFFGLDFSQMALNLAKDKAQKQFSDVREVSLVLADMHEIPIRSASITNAICLDALTYSTRPQVVVSEVFRILIPGGHFAFSTWQAVDATDVRLPPRLRADYSAILRFAGFVKINCHDRPDWLNSELAMLRRALVEFGATPTEDEAKRRLVAEAEAWLPVARLTRRVLFDVTKLKMYSNSLNDKSKAA